MRMLARCLAWFGAPLGLVFLLFGSKLRTPFLSFMLVVLGLLLSGLGLMFYYWYKRPNRAHLATGLGLENWEAVRDGQHNSNTDLIYWQGMFYLVHAASPYHFASKQCHLILRRSEDAHNWSKIAEFSSTDEDIRDPKLACINGKLFLFALVNRSFDPEPYTTVYATSLDGQNWSPFNKIEPQGWLFWRPKSQDGKTWYVPAYWWEHGKSVLFRTNDGENWHEVSTIYEGDRNDETDIEFLADGRLIATARLENSFNVFGDQRGCTLVTISNPPFAEWCEVSKSQVTRLDGPCLFAYQGRIYAAGRYQPYQGGPFAWQGSVFAAKRTSLYEVGEGGLKYLGDLPSAGDTSYVGAVLQGEQVYLCYYTSDTGKDYPWIIGMLEPSQIMMVKLDLRRLALLADTKKGG
jgi:hypothetical protein